jgi:hypothetical protein
MEPDYEKYWRYLDRYDLSDEEKRELIRTVWTMMESFVDCAFGTHPVQLAIKAKAPEISNAAPKLVRSKEENNNKTMLAGAFDMSAEPREKCDAP